MPKEGAAQRPFECPYCFFIITIKDRRAWARNIFRDLSSYICIFPDCSTGNKLYDSRKSWYRHVHDKHMSSEGTTGSYECPLCKESSLPSNSFQKHVGRHLEGLSLFVLPRTAEEDDEDEDEEEDGEEAQEMLDIEDISTPEEGEIKVRPIREKEELERIKKKVHDEEAREALYKAQMQAAAVEEWKLAEERRRVAEQEAEKKAEWQFMEHLKSKYGMTYKEISEFLRAKATGEQEKEKEKEDEEYRDRRRSESGMTEEDLQNEKKEEKRNTWIKIHRKHLLPDTLMAYQLPWCWDESDGNYIIIKTWISDELNDELFAHSRQLRKAPVNQVQLHDLNHFERNKGTVK